MKLLKLRSCIKLLYTAQKKIKEHFENTSDLNGGKIMLDIYTGMDWLMC